jgi:hypothetical protein
MQRLRRQCARTLSIVVRFLLPLIVTGASSVSRLRTRLMHSGAQTQVEIDWPMRSPMTNRDAQPQ